MKKNLLVLALLLLMLTVCAAPALADAMIWDVEPADYTVFVLTPDGGLNIRSGPGTSYDKLTDTPIPDYTPLHIDCTYDGWGETEYNGVYGWIYLAQTVTELPDVQPETSIEEQDQAAAAAEAEAEAKAEAAEEEAAAQAADAAASPDTADADAADDDGGDSTTSIIWLLLAAILVLIVVSLILLAALTKKRRRQ